jgi:hypothetical protein
MMRRWQAVAVFCGSLQWLAAGEEGKTFEWQGPKVVASIFSSDLGMLDSERDEYATNLAVHASNQVASHKASPGSLTVARRILALALQLSPRNKRAVVLNFQLSKGALPEHREASYSVPVLARLILTRGQLLFKQAGDENQKLARYLIQVAAEMDPENEDAVYASEIQRLDHGPVDWSAITDPTASKP